MFGDGRRVLSKYWVPLADGDEVCRIRSRSTVEHVSEIRDRLFRSVEDCLVADVPVGAFLSGGVDSSAVVSIMSRLMGRRVESVNVSYSEPDCDESRYARKAADFTGAKLHQISISWAEAENVLSDCLYHLDEPIADPAFINTFVASRYFRSIGVPVALVGEGADELFLGYPTYFRHERIKRFWSLSQCMPRSICEVLLAFASPMLGAFGLEVHRDLLRRMARGETLFLSSDHSFADYDKARLVGGQLRNMICTSPSASVTQAMLSQENSLLAGDFLAQVSLAETRMRMAEQLLMRVDKLTMAHSIEVRAPFLNWRLANYALSLPGSVRAPGGALKGLLKAALAGLVPEEILSRPKMGFSTPVRHWFHGWAGDRLLSNISDCDLFKTGLLSDVEVRRLLGEHRTGRRSHHPKLWNVLCLTEWWKRYRLDGVGTVACDLICRK